MRMPTFMQPFGRLRRGRMPGNTWLVPFLAATLVLSLWLGFQAMYTARSHREAAESALRDYAQIATWEYSAIARENLEETLDELFDDVPTRVRRDWDPYSPWAVLLNVDDAARRNRCDCEAWRNPVFAFRIDLPAGTAVTEPERAPGADRIARLVIARFEGARARRSTGMFTVPADSLLTFAAAVPYRITYSYDDPVAIYGLVLPVTALGDLFHRWVVTGRLLPPAITQETPNDSLLHIAVRDAKGATLYESTTEFNAPLVATDTVSGPFGPLLVEASVRPDAAGRLVIGGLPKSKLPLILSLLILTLGVGAAALFQLRRERELARLRDDFISGVSHELRTPLAQIRVFAELQAAGKLRSDVDRARAISVINRESQRLTHLVENILRFARLRRTGSRGFVTDEIDVADMLADLLEAFRPLAAARDMNIRVTIEPGLTLVANRDALNQMLVNLLDNAAKYGPAGQTITITAVRRRDRARFEIADEGPGVPTPERSRIWEPYVRLERHMDSRLPGTGLGLAVVAQLVDLHEGRVWVEDGDRRGALFVIELPGAGTRTQDDSETSREIPA